MCTSAELSALRQAWSPSVAMLGEDVLKKHVAVVILSLLCPCCGTIGIAVQSTWRYNRRFDVREGLGCFDRADFVTRRGGKSLPTPRAPGLYSLWRRHVCLCRPATSLAGVVLIDSCGNSCRLFYVRGNTGDLPMIGQSQRCLSRYNPGRGHLPCVETCLVNVLVLFRA